MTPNSWKNMIRSRDWVNWRSITLAWTRVSNLFYNICLGSQQILSPVFLLLSSPHVQQVNVNTLPRGIDFSTLLTILIMAVDFPWYLVCSCQQSDWAVYTLLTVNPWLFTSCFIREIHEENIVIYIHLNVKTWMGWFISSYWKNISAPRSSDIAIFIVKIGVVFGYTTHNRPTRILPSH